MFETHNTPPYYNGFEKDKFDKLCNMPTTDRIKLVYQWIKTGDITLRQFEFICEELLLGS